MIGRRRRSGVESRRRGARAGLTLVEVLVAIIVLGVAGSGLAAMTFWVGRGSFLAAGASSRSGAVVQQGERLSSLPFDSLASRVGCTHMAVRPFPYTRCVGIDVLEPGSVRVSVVLRPDNALIRADSVQFERTSHTPYKPFF